MKVQKTVVVVFFLLLSARTVFAELSVNPRIDIPLILSSSTLSALMVSIQSETNFSELVELDESRINIIDRPFAGRYSQDMAQLSDITQFTAFLLPPILYGGLSPEKDTLLSDLLILGEAVSLNYFLLRLMKTAVGRPRPLLYSDTIPDRVRRDPDNLSSFYSGHSAVTFTLAATLTMLARERELPRSAQFVVSGTAFSLAAITAGLRVAAGKHFPTDVIAGAVVSSLLSYVIVTLHMQPPDIDEQLRFEMNGNALGFRLSLGQ